MLAMESKLTVPLVDRGAYKLMVDCAGGGPTRVGRHRKRKICNYLLTSIDGGEVKVWTDREEAHIRPSGVFLVQPGQGFDLEFLKTGNLRYVHFSVLHSPEWEAFDHGCEFKLSIPPRQKFLQPSPQETWGVPLPLMVEETLKDRFLDRLPSIVDSWRDGRPEVRLDAHLELAELLGPWLRSTRRLQRQDNSDTVERRLAHAEAMARIRYGVDVSVEAMAQWAHCSRTHFQNLYHQRRGQSPGVFLRKLRLGEAAVLLRTQDLPVTHVGEAAGYPNTASFIRAFKGEYALTPSKYRQHHLLKEENKG